MYLHTNLQYKLLEIQSQISYYLGVFPFIWDPSTKKYIANEKAHNRFILTSLICTVQYIFMICTFLRLQFFSDELLKLQDLYISLIFLFALTLVHWDFYVFYFTKWELIELLNVVKCHTTHIAGKFKENGYRIGLFLYIKL